MRISVTLVLLPFVLTACDVGERAAEEEGPQPIKTVRAAVQERPGGPQKLVDMPVYEAPTDLPWVAAAEAPLEAGDLVLGVDIDGQAVAYPVRFLALYEIINDRVEGVPLAPTW